MSTAAELAARGGSEERWTWKVFGTIPRDTS
jgi:hypothetical protein